MDSIKVQQGDETNPDRAFFEPLTIISAVRATFGIRPTLYCLRRLGEIAKVGLHSDSCPLIDGLCNPRLFRVLRAL
jgi:hypothetical protein